MCQAGVAYRPCRVGCWCISWSVLPAAGGCVQATSTASFLPRPSHTTHSPLTHPLPLFPPLPTPTHPPAQLLDNKFFKTAHDNQYLQKHLLVGLPPAPERVALMRQGHVSRAPGSEADSQSRTACCLQQPLY